MFKPPFLESKTRRHAATVARFLCLVFLLRGLHLMAQAPSGESAPPPLVFTHVNVVDVAQGRTRSDQNVVIHAGRIAKVGPSKRTSVPRDAEVVEGTGKYLIPGLADMHVHLTNPIGLPQESAKFIAQLLRWGVTTVFSPALTLEDFKTVRNAAHDGAADLPRFYGVGHAFTAPGGHMFRFEHKGVEIPVTAEQARSHVRDLKSASVDAVKVIFDDLKYGSRPAVPAMKPEILAAILDEAHRNGLKVYAHASTLTHAKDFLRAGGDGLVHGIIDQPVDDEFLSLMKQRKSFYTATLSLVEALHDIEGFVRRQAEFDHLRLNPESVYAAFRNPEVLKQAYARFRGAVPEEHLILVRANLRRVANSGIPVATGTDTGVPGVLPGVASQLELVLFVEAGLTAAEALSASTLTAQRILGREREVGEIKEGRIADVVMLDGNPLSDIRNISKVNVILKGGVLHRPLPAPSPVGQSGGKYPDAEAAISPKRIQPEGQACKTALSPSEPGIWPPPSRPERSASSKMRLLGARW